MTKTELMVYLRISHDTLHRLMKAGLPYIKLNPGRKGRVLFRRAEIDAYLESKTVRKGGARKK